MATGWEAARVSLLWVGWPGLLLVSAYAISRSVRFYRSLRHSAPGLLVLLTTVGWVATLAGAALIATLYLSQDAQRAGPVVLPVFVLWAGSMVVVVWVVHKWGEETTTLDTYYGEVERMERMKSGFINHVAHELNTPITPLRMQVSLFRRQALGPLTEKQAEALQRMERNVDRLSALVEQVLLASFIQSGRMHLEPHKEDLVEICRQAAAALAQGPRPTPVQVEAPGPVRSTVDRQHFGYAVQALCAFVARRHEGPDPIVLQLSTVGAVARIEVHYEGPPIRQRDFDKFADPIVAQKQEGIAIELFNVQGIIALHGGRVEASDGRPLTVRVPSD